MAKKNLVSPPSRKVMRAALKAGLPETARSLRDMRHMFNKFRWDDRSDTCDYCLDCLSNEETPLVAAGRALDDAKRNFQREKGVFDALAEDAALIRIRPGKAPEEARFGFFRMLRSGLHLTLSRYVDSSVHAAELKDVCKMVEDALGAIEKVVQAAES